jgi:hypothetical protein
MESRFPDVSCPSCRELEQLYTVPLKMIPPSAEKAWQALCADCFRQVLEAEPTDDLLMVPIRHGRR